MSLAHNKCIALPQAVQRQGEPPQAIARQRIHTGLIEDELRQKLPCPLKGGPQCSQVGVVRSSNRQLDIERACLLVKRKIPESVKRQGENARVPVKDGRSSIALMNVQI